MNSAFARQGKRVDSCNKESRSSTTPERLFAFVRDLKLFFETTKRATRYFTVLVASDCLNT
jgi:hypothetical protein